MTVCNFLLDCFSGRPIGFLFVSLHMFYNSILTLYTVFPALYTLICIGVSLT